MRNRAMGLADSANLIRLVFLALILVVTIGLVSTHLGYARNLTPSVGVGAAQPLKVIEEQGDLEIQSVVALPDDEFLVVATTGDSRSVGEVRGSCYFRFGGNGSQLYSAQIVGIGTIGDGRRSIRCSLVQQEPWLRLDQTTRVSVKLEHLGGRTIATSSSQIPLLFWTRLVFESLFTDQEVVLFTKGILPARKEEQERALLNRTRCVFLDDTNTHIVAESVLLGVSQEIVRCRHPPLDLRYSLLGNRVSIITGPGAIPEPSVVFYDVPRITDTSDGSSHSRNAAVPADARKRHLVCACTMIYNGAKFLHEWIQYHSHLGVEKFILYDNNSEDKLEQTVQDLNTDGFAATVTTRTWPWIKTQESGFSHCALTSRSECEWMAFIDVDEFIYPRHWLPKGQVKGGPKEESEPPEEVGKGAFFAVDQTILSRVINDAEKQKFPGRNVSTGQISFHCREFGPSGLTKHPEAGVTQGYTCRRSREQRHKSLVRLDALDQSLTNVIHHFWLSPRYSTVSIPTWKGVVNHYKYQAWDEFRNKFKRRVSAYVVDWKEGKNINSQDRTPGLGKEAVKPATWERQFCEVEDTGLKEYIGKLFRPRVQR